MKKLIVLLFVLGCAEAQAQSMLNVRTADNSPINVAVDGRYFNKRGTSVTVGDLPPGKHLVQIYMVTRNRRGRGQEEVVYDGRVRTYEAEATLMTYDLDSRRPDLQQQSLSDFTANHPAAPSGGNNGSNYYPQNGNGGGYQQNGNGMNNGGYPQNGNNMNGGYSQNGSGMNNGNYTPPVATGTLTDTKIDQVKNDVTAKKTDTEKETLLKSELAGEKLTTAQVSMMMDWLSFESSKEDFAEWAWNSTVDKDAYSGLENKFTYKTYQDALDKFLKTH